MTAEALPLRIFLASPGDLEAERAAVRATVDDYNSRSPGGVGYEVVGWERIRGTARRPQDAINELIAESHFMLVLFKGLWGSRPGSPWGYTSGTEEEFFEGLLALGRTEDPMRDIWVAFFDDAEQDQRISKLRRQISRRNAMMYERISSVSELKHKLAERLDAWEPLAGPKVSRRVELLPSSGLDVLGAQRHRLRGEKLIELGQTEAGRDALETAAEMGGPTEHLALARFRGRQGDLDGALEQTGQAIGYFAGGDLELYSAAAAEAFAAEASVLRRQGRDRDAVGRLKQALTLVEDTDRFGETVRCRILDDLGLALQTLGDLEAARLSFNDALTSRSRAEDPPGIAQSLVNLARLEVGAGNLEVAVRYAAEVAKVLDGTPPNSLHANAEVLTAQLRLRQGRPADAIPHAENALSLNLQLASMRGQAYSLYVLAQCCRAAGRDADAVEYASDCISVNRAMGNASGEKKAQWILGQLSTA